VQQEPQHNETSVAQPDVQDVVLRIPINPQTDKIIRSIASGSPGGSDTQIQFNDGGSFGGNSLMTFDKSASGSLFLSTPAGSGSGSGGTIDIAAGSGGSSGAGGGINITSGYAGGGNTTGGNIDIAPGDGSGSGAGGTLYLRGGLKSSGDDGNVITGGTRSSPGQITPSSANGGFLVIPRLSGAPSGVPVNPASICFDTTNNKLYAYNSAWYYTVFVAA